MNAIVVVGSSIKIFKSEEDYNQNKIYQDVPYGFTMDPTYNAFLKKAVAEKRLINKLNKANKIIEDQDTIAYQITPWTQQQSFLNTINKNRLCGMIEAPTGSGKTNMFSFLIGKMNVYTLVIVPTSDLIEQTRNRIISVLKIDSKKVGRFNAKHKEIRPITVSTWQSLKTQKTFKQFLDYGFNMIIADEAHRASALKYGDILSQYPAKYKFGFSASAFHTKEENTEKMHSLLGKTFFKVDIENLYKDGHLVRPTIAICDTKSTFSIKDAFIQKYKNDTEKNPKFFGYMKYKIEKASLLKTIDLKTASKDEIFNLYFEIDDFGQKYAHAFDSSLFPNYPKEIDADVRKGAFGIYKAGVDMDEARSETILHFVLSTIEKAGKSLILFNTIEKCEAFQKNLLYFGINTKILTGQTKEKQTILRDFTDNPNALPIIGTTSLLGEGIDIPALNTLYVGSNISPPFFDQARGVQVAGRVVRACIGKTDANLIFFRNDTPHQWIRVKEEGMFNILNREFHPKFISSIEMVQKITHTRKETINDDSIDFSYKKTIKY